MWTKPWTAVINWKASRGELLEYACHEGNYSLPRDAGWGARGRSGRAVKPEVRGANPSGSRGEPERLAPRSSRYLYFVFTASQKSLLVCGVADACTLM